MNNGNIIEKIKRLIIKDKKIDAIIIVRKWKSLNFKEAKEYVEKIQEELKK